MRNRHLALLVLWLLGCSKTEAPPASSPDAASTPSAPAGLTLDLRWDRAARSLEVHGLPGAGQGWELFAQAAEAAGAERLVVAHPGRDADLPDGLGLLWPRLLAMEGLTLHVDAGVLEATGVARNKALADEAQGPLAALFGPGRRSQVTITVEPTALADGEGRLVTADGAPLASLAPKRLGKGASGEAAPTDEQGRLLDGLYELADGRTAVVEAGRVTTLPTGPAIVVDGRRFALDLGDVSKIEGTPRVVLPSDEGGMGFEGAKTPDEMPCWGPRWLSPGKRLEPGTLADDRRHREHIEALVIGASGTPDAEASHRALVARSLSAHFIIDFDGTIFETLDPIHAAYYAGDANNRGIIVELVMPTGDLLEEPGLPAHPAAHARLAEMNAHPRVGPGEAVIHGKARKHWGPTAAQTRSLVALTRTLAAIFPALREGPPEVNGAVSLGLAAPRGVVGTLHLSAESVMPGAAFDWARLEPALMAPPAMTPVPIAVAPLRARAATPPGAAPKLAISWSYLDGLEVRGLPNEGPVVADAIAKVEALGVRRVRFLEPGPCPFTEAEQRAFIDAVLLLASGDLELAPSIGANVPAGEQRGLVYVTGAALHSGVKAQVDEVLGRVAGVRAVLDLRHVDALSVPGAGVLDLGAFDEKGGVTQVVVPLKATPSGLAVTPDPAGRVAPGLYELPDGTLAAVHLGHRTTVSLEAPSVTVAGRRFHLDGSVLKVVAPGDSGALAFEGQPRPEATSLDTLRGAVGRAVIGADFALDTAAGHAALRERGLSAHFMIDFDGTLHQTLDPAQVGPGMEPGAVYVVLNHTLDNLERDPKALPYPAKHPRLAEIQGRKDRERDGPDKGVINFAKVSSYGYTSAQYDTLGALLLRLTEIFPRLGAGFPWESERDVVPHLLDEVRDGLVFAYHEHATRWDPGPGLRPRLVAWRLAKGGSTLPYDKLGVRGAGLLIARLMGLGPRDLGLIRDPRVQLEALDPTEWDLPKILRGDLLEAAQANAGILSNVAARSQAGAASRGPHQRVLRVMRATGAELAAGPVAGFPDDLRAVAGGLVPEAEWYAWEIGDPLRPEQVELGHGLVRVEGREWFFMPKVWRVVAK